MNNTAEIIETISTQIAEFSEFESRLAEYKDKYAGVVYDLTEPDQERQARSDRLAIGKVISKLDSTHKRVKAPLKERVDLLDGERKRIKDQLLEIQDRIKDQIAEHESKIQAEKDALLRKASVFRDLREFEFPPTAAQVQDRIDKINAIEIDDSYGEMKPYAALNKMESLQILEPMLAGLKAQAEAAAAEEAARKEAEAKARQEREEQIAREAAEKAKAEAAESVARERMLKESAEREREQAIERAELAKSMAKKSAQEAAERAEREKAEAVERAQLEAKEQAELLERNRLSAIAKEKAEQEKREANKRHLAKINNAAVAALVDHAGLTKDQAQAVVVAIAKKSIPAVSINY